MNEVTATFDPVAESVRRARRFVVDTLDEWGSDAGDDASLLVSELATNAVIHAGTAYTITVTITSDVLRIGVADGSVASARRCHYGDTAATGRGLGMVADVSSAWGVDTAATGKVIWFEIVARTGEVERDLTRTHAAVDVDVDLDGLLAELGGWDGTDEDPNAPKARLSVGGWA